MYPRIVTLLGGGGLAGALAYFAGVYLAFQPGWEQWAAFFVPWSVPLMVIPCVLLIAYLYMRARVGRWYVERGRIDEAIAFSRPRIEPDVLLRSRREVLFHRIALACAYLARREYERVEELLDGRDIALEKGRLALEAYRWRFEAALRAEHLVRCHHIWEEASDIGRPKRLRAYLLACRGELAVREGDWETFEWAVGEAAWVDRENPRVQLVEVLGAARFDATDSRIERARAMLGQVIEPIAREVPGRKAELLALRAELAARVGRTDDARKALAAARRAPTDERSQREIDRVQEIFESSRTTSSIHP